MNDMKISAKTHRIARRKRNYILNTVTQAGMVKSQPGIGFSVTTGTHMPGAVISVYRYYPKLKNEIGGYGKFLKLADDGKRFENREIAEAYAFEKGYLQEHFISPELRRSRKETGKAEWERKSAKVAADHAYKYGEII